MWKEAYGAKFKVGLLFIPLLRGPEEYLEKLKAG
jgi:hypothetical protein